MAARRRPETKAGGPQIKARDSSKNYDKDTPKFCLRHLANGYSLTELDVHQRAAFAMALQKRATLTWVEIKQLNRHKLGYEFIPVAQFKPPIPPTFDGEDQIMVFRYDGMLPMAGIRADDTFHVFWVERAFNELYDHG